MIIATSITEDYLKRSMPFFLSVSKHFTGKKILFCIGFTLDHAAIDGWEIVCIDQSNLKYKLQGFPKNRESFYTLQQGEFVDWYDFKDEDEVLFVDSDMILQRPFDLQFDFNEADFFVSDSSFPSTKLTDVIVNLGQAMSDTGSMLDHPSQYNRPFRLQYQIDPDEVEFCSGWMCAKIKNWKKLHELSLKEYRNFLKYFSHHAAWQLFINYLIINWFKYFTVDPMIQNAEWYSGTIAERKNDTLMYRDKTVYFNHTKFNGDWKY